MKLWKDEIECLYPAMQDQIITRLRINFINLHEEDDN